MTILVTGISGFIGSHMASMLASLGHDVIGTYRNNPPRIFTDYKNVSTDQDKKVGLITPIQANLSDRQTVIDLVSKVEGIIHIAAHTSDWGSKQIFYNGNILPVRHFIDALTLQDSDTQVRFFIHTSTIAVHGFGNHRSSTEDGPYYRLMNEYQRSKFESEQILLKRALENAKPAIGIIRPGNVYGPGDTTMIYPILNAIRDGKVLYVNKGKYLTCPIFIDDLLGAYLALMTKLINAPSLVHGRVYNITSDELITWREKFELCVNCAGLKPLKFSVPVWLALPLSGMLATAFALIHAQKEPSLTPYRIRNITNDYHFTVQRAMKELEWQPRVKFSEGIIPTIEAWKKYSEA